MNYTHRYIFYCSMELKYTELLREARTDSEREFRQSMLDYYTAKMGEAGYEY